MKKLLNYLKPLSIVAGLSALAGCADSQYSEVRYPLPTNIVRQTSSYETQPTTDLIRVDFVRGREEIKLKHVASDLVFSSSLNVKLNSEYNGNGTAGTRLELRGYDQDGNCFYTNTVYAPPRKSFGIENTRSNGLPSGREVSLTQNYFTGYLPWPKGIQPKEVSLRGKRAQRDW